MTIIFIIFIFLYNTILELSFSHSCSSITSICIHFLAYREGEEQLVHKEKEKNNVGRANKQILKAFFHHLVLYTT